MKRFILILTVLSPFLALAQEDSDFKYGVRFGIGQSEFKNSSLQNQQGKLSLSAGLTATYLFNEYVGLGVDALFVSKGSKNTADTTVKGALGGSTQYTYHEVYRLFYAEIPLLAKVRFGSGNFHFQLFAGPGINFNLLGTSSRSYDDAGFDEQNGYNDIQVNNLNVIESSFTYGAGVDIRTKDNRAFYLDIRKSTGLSGFATSPVGRNDYFSIGVGYSY